MTFLVDQQLPPRLAQWLSALGSPAVHVREIGLRDASDAEIWDWAAREGVVVVTKDEDFAARRAREDGPKVVWLRIGNATNKELFAWLDAARWLLVVQELKANPLVEVR